MMTRFLILLAALILLPGIRARADSSQMDVVVVLWTQQDGTCAITVTYPTVVPHARVQQEFAALQSLTKWTIRSPKIDDSPGPGNVKMTSLVFSSPDAIAPHTRAFPIEPIVTALKSHSHLLITYFLDAPVDYLGLREYGDNNVSVNLDSHGSNYTYHVRILNPGFQKLNLPLYQPSPAKLQVAASEPANRRAPVRPWQVALLAVVAAAAGAAVYFAMTKHT